MDNSLMEYNNHNKLMMVQGEEEDKKRWYNKLLNSFVKDIIGNCQTLKVLPIHDYIDRNSDRMNPLFDRIKQEFYVK
jgi:hypothetical protein